jgi:hypothetical protein
MFDTIPSGAVVPLAIVWMTAAISLALTAVLAHFLRNRFSFATLCAVGIGVAPLIVYLAIFIPFYVYEASQLATVPFWHSFTSMALFTAPSYVASFVITSVVLITSRVFKATQEAAAVLFVILVPLHGLGLYFSYWLLTHPGSL